MGANKMGIARQAVLKKALTINKIILYAFEEALEEKEANEIKKQIEETKVLIKEKGVLEDV
jgi:seryl-tRNA(Sec) selenium transferase